MNRSEITCEIGKVIDIAITRGSKFSVVKTVSTVYFPGEWCHIKVRKPLATCLSTMDEVFAAANPSTV